MTRDISNYPYISKFSIYLWWLVHKQYKMIKMLTNIYHITMCRLKYFYINLIYKLTLFDRPLQHFKWSVVIHILYDYISKQGFIQGWNCNLILCQISIKRCLKLETFENLWLKFETFKILWFKHGWWYNKNEIQVQEWVDENKVCFLGIGDKNINFILC